MKLYEYEGLELFRLEGIDCPKFSLVSNPEEAREKAQAIGFPVVIKTQVLSGGRYLAGGVKNASTTDEVFTIARSLLNLKVGGFPVNQLIIAPQVDIKREVYLGITIDEYIGTPVAILSPEGGVAINAIARERPETLISKPISISQGLSHADARRMCRDVGLRGNDFTEVSNILFSLYQAFRKNDALLAEINPLVKTDSGHYLALDAKVEIDDSSLYRHPELKLSRTNRIFNPLERKGREIGVAYVELDGDIAIIASGAGLGMASMDIVNRKLRAANFLETGGAITEDLLYQVTDLVLQKKGIRALFINVYGGINPIHEGAKG
ncbi:MAG TPA: ATP-grasp domain-containing protein, partial [Dehalococcoidia bacterium]|nr:ATP-grasp domain-containing protein [Dehalococcoidia bacterium]